MADLGRYRLGRLLGRGGMGEVYLADDLLLGRPVAVKFVAADRTAHPDATRRLLREAQAAAALDHPCICTIYEAGESSDGRAFIVMQYVEGEPLSALLARGPLGVRDALSLCAQIADALGVAHRHGIIHRDLKPSNVLVGERMRPKLLDFGIAKLVAVPAGLAERSTASGGTTDGTIVGTASYMSPEQIQQRPLDGRSDIFALGVLLYECFTCRRPFDGPTSFETMANVLHVHPPPPSTINPELTDAHDELCARLLAKDPSDRFQSAAEVLGALRMLLPDTSRTHAERQTGRPAGSVPGRPWWRRARARTVVGLAALLAIAGWWLTRPTPLPQAPPDAERHYRRGTDAIREGAYQGALLSLEEAVRLFPAYVLAYARLAEAHAELDDERAAQRRLLRVDALVPNEARLPGEERPRLRAVRALVLRELDAAIAHYRELAGRNPADAGAWLDLGRAQEAAGLRTDAARAYETAIARDRQYAPAHLRLGTVAGLESRRDAALAAFGEAERLYRTASNVEGEAETLLRRGAARDGFGDVRGAREDLVRALALANTAGFRHQQVRARLALSSISASEGRFDEAETLASAAVQEAVAAGLDTIAADGLVDLAATLRQAGRSTEAEGQARRAVRLAEQRGARRTLARARLQLAEIREALGRPADALADIQAVLPFLRDNSYRRYELTALQIASRAHRQLDQLERARQLSAENVAAAERLGDESQLAIAASTLASVLTDLGSYPDALLLRERAEAIRRRLGDLASLPYDLVNRADLLIRLGRAADAERVLDEVDAGIAARQAAFTGRERRAIVLRAFAAATHLRCGDAGRLAARVTEPGAPDDFARALGAGVAAFCAARLRSPGAPPPPATADPALLREQSYWLAAAALARGDPDGALATALRGLEALGELPNHELRLRIGTLAAAAARQSRNPRATELTAQARQALDGLRRAWAGHAAAFERRPDIVDLKVKAGLD